MSETMPHPDERPSAPAPSRWDPFQLMDRLDEEALRKELEGVAGTDLVYVVREGGQEVVGLSKTGVDECCMALVAQGQVIREEDLQYEVIGDGEDREALFKVKAARFAVSPPGRRFGSIRSSASSASRSTTSRPGSILMPGCRARSIAGRTYRELLRPTRGEITSAGWRRTSPSRRSATSCGGSWRARRSAASAGGSSIPHWYEAGAMKAARNARFRLIPGNVRAQVIATRAAGRPGPRRRGAGRCAPRRLEGRPAQRARPPERCRAAQEPLAEVVTRAGPYAPTEKQVAFYQRLAESPVFTEEERRRALEWLATKATRQTIKDQIDWLKRQVETRRASRGQSAA